MFVLLDARVLVLGCLSFLLVLLLAVWMTVWVPWCLKPLGKCLVWLFGSDLHPLENSRFIADWLEANEDEENNLSQEDNGPRSVTSILSRSRAAEEAFIALGSRILNSNPGITLFSITACVRIFLIIAEAGTAFSFLELDGNALSPGLDYRMWATSSIKKTASQMGAIIDAAKSYSINTYKNNPSTQACGR